ncbi:hypothetical protein GCM10011579_001380 [Streptomyces albiflavescens]|uniref:Uncharacterized protein n=1 Tax=Streptomyces albiflavescens TaxID=1623582 RepID=A0A917XQ21_9ACTN|nr:hypothetical protein GCM10011579_001380 [Streptomyces albiflavescens]
MGESRECGDGSVDVGPLGLRVGAFVPVQQGVAAKSDDDANSRSSRVAMSTASARRAADTQPSDCRALRAVKDDTRPLDGSRSSRRRADDSRDWRSIPFSGLEIHPVDRAPTDELTAGDQFGLDAYEGLLG